MSVDVLWQVACVWYEGRMDPGPLTRAAHDKQNLLARAGLTGPFWTLPR